nr:DUF6264 family protein [Curtobacterium sp. MCPF17_001]
MSRPYRRTRAVRRRHDGDHAVPPRRPGHRLRPGRHRDRGSVVTRAGDDGRSGPDPVGGREARPGLRGGRRVADVVATVVLLLLGAVATVVASRGIQFMALSFGSCDAPGNRCDEGLGGTVVTLGPVVVALVFLVTLVLCVLRLVRRRLTWPVALLGLGVLVVVFVVARLLAGGAVSIGI